MLQRLTYLNEVFFDCRLRGLHSAIYKGETTKARDMVAECLRIFRSGNVDMTRDIYDASYDGMFHVLGDIAMRRYAKACERIYDLHLFIQKKQEEEKDKEFEEMMELLLSDA